MYRALYFPPCSLKPEFCWVSKSRALILGKTTNDDINEIIQSRGKLKGYHVTASVLNSEELQCPLIVFTDSEYEARYSGPNMSIIKSTDGLAKRAWGGPIVAVAGQPGERDFNMVDFQQIIAFFIVDYHNDNLIIPRFGLKVPAVMMPCKGEKRLKGITKSQPVLAPRLHLMREAACDMSAVSRVMAIVEYLERLELTHS
jgi:hypothetical protein